MLLVGWGEKYDYSIRKKREFWRWITGGKEKFSLYLGGGRGGGYYFGKKWYGEKNINFWIIYTPVFLRLLVFLVAGILSKL